MSEKICVLGVAGGSASGKTTIINKLQDYFGEDIAVISHDAYYKSHPEMTLEERSHLNYDHPDSFESDRMAEDVRKLIKGYAIDMPVYDYVIQNGNEYKKIFDDIFLNRNSNNSENFFDIFL